MQRARARQSETHHPSLPLACVDAFQIGFVLRRDARERRNAVRAGGADGPGGDGRPDANCRRAVEALLKLSIVSNTRLNSPFESTVTLVQSDVTTPCLDEATASRTDVVYIRGGLSPGGANPQPGAGGGDESRGHERRQPVDIRSAKFEGEPIECLPRVTVQFRP